MTINHKVTADVVTVEWISWSPVFFYCFKSKKKNKIRKKMYDVIVSLGEHSKNTI